MLILASLCGCGRPDRVNPSFDLSGAEATAALREMRQSPARLARPLVILGGFADPFSASLVRGRMQRLFTEDSPRIISVSFVGCTSFEQCRLRVLQTVDDAFGIDDARRTVEVDVIGLSMGGLVARVAADPNVADARRLRIARLFTVSSPLQGARLAEFPLVLTTMHRDMRIGSALLARLNERQADYEIYPYTRLRDSTVGAALAAPEGEIAWWVEPAPLEGGHLGSALDRRILADIARRLRGEEPFATEPRAPLPEDRAAGDSSF